MGERAIAAEARDLTKDFDGKRAVDGVSLTLVDVERQRFSVQLIPHTLAVTTLGNRRVGDEVNLETDLLAKYVERQLGNRSTSPSPGTPGEGWGEGLPRGNAVAAPPSP